jgi:recombination protein RecT
MSRFVNNNYNNAPATSPKQGVIAIKNFGNSPANQRRFQDVLGEKAPAFIASVLGAVNNNSALQKAEPSSVFGAAMIAATLNLSVVPTLGQAAIVPYGNNAQFQVMVRGLVQLAQRTGLYRNINAGEVYEDEYDGEDLLTGEVTFHRVNGGYRDNGQTDKIVGYFAFFETTTGFRKTEYWTKADIINHAKRYSKSFNNGPWQTNFDSMARKTVLKSLLNHYGPMSVDSSLAQAVAKDQTVVHTDGTEGYDDNPLDETPITTDDEKQPVNAPTEEKSEITPPSAESQPQGKEIALETKIAIDDDENF